MSLLLLAGSCLAGPFGPVAGQPGSAAVSASASTIQGWASTVVNYAVGTDCLPQWQNTRLALGPAGSDPTQITCLGAGGQITLAFPGFVWNGPGADFAVFENGITDSFLELAYVEVSQDGVNFVRFPGQSLTAQAVSSFGGLDPTNVKQLGSKYRGGFGEPYDLADVGMAWISNVRLVDIPGDGTRLDSQNRPIYDPFPNAQSAGFDLDGVAAMNLTAWQFLPMGTLQADQVNAVCLAHLPSGLVTLGLQGKLRVQSAWGNAASVLRPTSGLEFDPSFIAVKDATEAVLGTGGGFFSGGALHRFNPSTATAPQAVPLAMVENYSGAYWHSPTTAREGWLVLGTQAPNFKSRVRFVSLDGSRSGPVTQDLSNYSGGLAVDASGNVYAAQYELEGTPTASEADVVRKFSATDIETAVAAVLNNAAAPLPRSAGQVVHRFDTAGSLTVDARGRLWASGFKTHTLQGFDPATGGGVRLTPPHGLLSNVSDASYQVSAFTRLGVSYLGFVVADEAAAANSAVVYGMAPLDALPMPQSYASWQAFHGVGEGTDSDGDGLSNLLEYALATSPTHPNASPVAISSVAGRLKLTFPRDPNRPDVTIAVEAAAQLVGTPWTTLATSAGGQSFTPTAGVTENFSPSGILSIQLQDNVLTTAQNRRFLRLRVTLTVP